ncbi:MULTISPECIES: DUF4998 domain-containing protein [Petrimonas]|uniref:DUF4998 domain-containing protein n=1 Tax=Petrimonas TaxID=307628 RepID=UPI001776CACB|nr:MULTISPECIES: DUF4998 domain-containing protein [Petrimonas]HHT29471.1 hypothetical protein [Petrimonas mucosa]
MKKIKSIITVGILLALLSNYGCDSMEDNFKQYLKEYNYSGKIDSLRVYPGFERVILAWNNPKDQKSKSIKIVYGPDSTVVTYDSLVDSVSIEGLDAGTGYEFIVYTMDAKNNLSVPTSITAFPVSKAFVNALTPPSIIVQAIGADQYITVIGTSNVLMRFAGDIEYTVTGADGFTQSGSVQWPEKAGATQVDLPVAGMGITFLPPGEYTFSYKVSVFPIVGNLVSVDEVWLENTQTVFVQPVVINLMTVPGVVTESNNNSPGAENIDKIIDNNPDTKYLTFNSTAWIVWKMDRAFAATRYTLTSANDDDSRDPRDWTVEGSNDGITWTELDRQTNFPRFPQRKHRITFPMTNRTAYTHYRLNVTANHGSGIFQLADWILYYDSGEE